MGVTYPVRVAQGALVHIGKAPYPVERHLEQKQRRGHYVPVIPGNRNSKKSYEKESHNQVYRSVVIRARAPQDYPQPILGQIVPPIAPIFDDTAVQAKEQISQEHGGYNANRGVCNESRP